jgi:hypothetical protein
MFFAGRAPAPAGGARKDPKRGEGLGWWSVGIEHSASNHDARYGHEAMW